MRVCDSCRNGNSDDDWECVDRLMEREVRAVNSADDTLAEVVLSHVLYSESAIGRMIVDGAGPDRTRAFVVQALAAG
jgi:hypothetical protein